MSEVRIFSRDYYRALHDIERRHPWARAMRRVENALLRRFTERGQPLDVLDAGCGAGVFLAELTAVRAHVRPWGGDLSREALRFSLRAGHTRLAQFDVRWLPFPAASFDVVVSNDVLQHMGRVAAAETLREAVRVLRPGGLLIVRTAARRGILWRKHRNTRDYRQWRTRSLRRLLAQLELQTVFLARVNWLPSLLGDLRGLFKPRPSGDIGLELRPDEPMWKDRLLELYWRLERLLVLGLRLRLPLGHNLIAVAVKPERS